MGERSGKVGGEGHFGEECRKEIGDILGVLDDDRFSDFWDVVCVRGLRMRRLIEMTPSSFQLSPVNATATQRIEWLNTNVVCPIERLEGAGNDENLPYFHHWEDGSDPKRMIANELLDDLAELRAKAEALTKSLQTEIQQDISHSSEIRFDIVYNALGDLHEHFPEIKLSRGNWDREYKCSFGRVPDYVRRVFFRNY